MENKVKHHTVRETILAHLSQVACNSQTQSSGVENEKTLICYYCKKEGHVKTQCPKLKEKEKRQEKDKSQPNGLVHTALACMQNHIVHDFDHTKQSDELRDDVDHHDEIDERYKDFFFLVVSSNSVLMNCLSRY